MNIFKTELTEVAEIISLMKEPRHKKKFEAVLLELQNLASLNVEVAPTIYHFLLHAIRFSNTDIIKTLLDFAETDIYYGYSSENLLELALLVKDPGIIEMLLESGAGIFSHCTKSLPSNLNDKNFLLIGSNLTTTAGIKSLADLKRAIENGHFFSPTLIKNCKRFLDKKPEDLKDDDVSDLEKIVHYLDYYHKPTSLKIHCLNLINTNAKYQNLNFTRLPAELHSLIFFPKQVEKPKQIHQPKLSTQSLFRECIEKNAWDKLQLLLKSLTNLSDNNLTYLKTKLVEMVPYALEKIIPKNQPEILWNILEFYPNHLFIKVAKGKKTLLQFAIDMQAPAPMIQILLKFGAGICSEITGKFPKEVDTTNIILIGFKINKKLVTHEQEEFKHALLNLSDLKKYLIIEKEPNTSSLVANCRYLLDNKMSDNVKSKILKDIIELCLYPVSKGIVEHKETKISQPCSIM